MLQHIIALSGPRWATRFSPVTRRVLTLRSVRGGAGRLLVPQDFERLPAQDVEAREPAGRVGQQGGGDDGDGIRQQLKLEAAVEHAVE